MKLYKNKRAMTTLEYSVLVCVLLAALLGMQVVLRRAIAGKWRASADSFASGRQYEQGTSIITVH